MQPARFRLTDFSLVKINNAKSKSPAQPWVRGRSAGSFPEQRLVIEPTLSSIYRYKPIVTYGPWRNVKRCLYNLGETQTCNYYYFVGYLWQATVTGFFFSLSTQNVKFDWQWINSCDSLNYIYFQTLRDSGKYCNFEAFCDSGKERK